MLQFFLSSSSRMCVCLRWSTENLRIISVTIPLFVQFRRITRTTSMVLPRSSFRLAISSLNSVPVGLENGKRARPGSSCWNKVLPSITPVSSWRWKSKDQSPQLLYQMLAPLLLGLLNREDDNFPKSPRQLLANRAHIIGPGARRPKGSTHF